MATIDRSACTARYHGDENAYSSARCRCPDARAAWTIYQRNRRNGTHQPRLIDATPTAQRLRILAGIGYDWRTLARLLGYRSPRGVTELAYLARTNVQRRTATRVRDLYRRLIAAPAPHGYAAGRAINNALRNGWGVVDLEAVHQALAGKRPNLTPLERKAVIYAGAAYGLSTALIAGAARASYATVHAALAA